MVALAAVGFDDRRYLLLHALDGNSPFRSIGTLIPQLGDEWRDDWLGVVVQG